METKFDVGDEVFVKCIVNKIVRERSKDKSVKTRYEIGIPGVGKGAVAEENELFEIPKEKYEKPRICGSCEHCRHLHGNSDQYICGLDGTSVSFWQASICTKFKESNKNLRCCDCKYCYVYDTMTFLEYRCSKHKIDNEVTLCCYPACNEFEDKDE